MKIENFKPFSGQHCETTATGTLLLQIGIDQWDEEYPNIKVLAKYTKKEYEFVGTVRFRKGIFNCYEKAVK